MEGTREGGLPGRNSAFVGTVLEALGLISNSDTYNKKRMSKEAFRSHCLITGNILKYLEPRNK